MTGEIKLFAMNDCDLVAAKSLEEAKEFYSLTVSSEPESIEDAEEISDELADRLQFADSECINVPRSLREQLHLEIARGATFPAFFASTEY